MQLAAAGYLKAVRRIGLLHAKADVGVQFAEQTLSDMTGGDKFTFLSCQRAVVYHEVHGDSRFGYLLERNGFRVFRRAERITDMNIRNTGNGHDRADSRFRHFHLVQSLVLVQLSYLNLAHLVRVVMVYDDTFLIDTDRSVIHLAYADTAYVLVVIDGADQKLSRRFRVSLWSRYMVDDCLE